MTEPTPEALKAAKALFDADGDLTSPDPTIEEVAADIDREFAGVRAELEALRAVRDAAEAWRFDLKQFGDNPTVGREVIRRRLLESILVRALDNAKRTPI
jgi:hypothetical protein